MKAFCFIVLILNICVTVTLSIEYKIIVKTGRGYLSGTDSDYQVTLVSANNSKRIFIINGGAKKLERGSEDTFVFNERLMSNVDYITIERVSPFELFHGWFLCWIKIEFNGSVYQGIVNKWIKDEAPHTFRISLESCKQRKKRLQYCANFVD